MTLEVRKKILENIANDILEENTKPNLSNRDFMNCLLIFQFALMDKLYEVQEYDNMPLKQRELMAEKCGNDLRDLIYTYTNLDTHKVEEFL